MAVDGPTGGELVDRLAGIGLEEREAKLFVHLSLRGPSRASDAAAATKLKRTETYRALESLMKRGFVTAHLTRPVVYEAVAPEVFSNDLLAAHEQRRTEIERLRDGLRGAIARARRDADEPGAKHGHKIIQGRRAIFSAVEAAVRGARESHCLASTTFAPQHASAQNRAWPTFVRRAADGLPMRLLLRDSPGLDRALQPLTSHANVQVRLFDPPHPIRFVVVDAREIVCWLVSEESHGIEARDDVAMWTNASDFVRAQQTLFDVLWERARETVRVPAT